MKFTIETVSKMTGISAASLRNWEKRYGFPKPERTEGGHRFYSSKDIDFLKKAVHLIENGHCLSQLAIYYGDMENLPTEKNQRVEAPEVLDDVSYRVELLYESLLKFDPSAVQMHYQILNTKLSPDGLFDRVFEYLLIRMGIDWQQGRISIAQEHYASSFIRLKTSSFLAIDFPATRTQRILAAAPCGESHEGGILLVSAHLKFRGYPVYYFGTDLPVTDLISVCEDLEPQVVMLSYFSADNLLKDLEVFEHLNCPVVIGGNAVGDSRLEEHLKRLNSANILLCRKTVGSEAAHFIETVSHGKFD